MTNSMPEKIFAGYGPQEPCWDVAPVKDWNGDKMVEYTRSDTIAAKLEAAEKMAEELRECCEQLAILAKDPDNNPWVKQAKEALENWQRVKGE